MAEKKKKKNKGPKAERKARKKDKKEKKKKSKYSKKVALYVDLSAEAKKAITEVDRAEASYLDAEDKLHTALTNLQAALPKPSFEHPDRGPMSVMQRGKVLWWRQTPKGR